MKDQVEAKNASMKASTVARQSFVILSATLFLNNIFYIVHLINRFESIAKPISG